MQAWERTGVPGQPLGEELATVRVCVPFDWQAPQALYVYVQAGGTYVQVWERAGEPPVQPEGVDVSTVRVWVLSGWQAPQAE